MGLIKSLLRLKVYALLFGAGYITHSCVHSDEQYSIRRIGNQPYLIDKTSGNEFVIHATAQVGSIEHRLRGLLAEKDLSASLEALIKQLEKKK